MGGVHMVTKRYFMFSAIFIILIVSGACVTTLQNYQPKNPDEILIKELLIKFENTYNNQDVLGFLFLWNDKAQIMIGSERKVFSKMEYAQILPARLKNSPRITVGAPSINIMGDKCEASFVLSRPNVSNVLTLYLIKENGHWSIIGNSYK
jgi:hypothetical protein